MKNCARVAGAARPRGDRSNGLPRDIGSCHVGFRRTIPKSGVAPCKKDHVHDRKRKHRAERIAMRDAPPVAGSACGSGYRYSIGRDDPPLSFSARPLAKYGPFRGSRAGRRRPAFGFGRQAPAASGQPARRRAVRAHDPRASINRQIRARERRDPAPARLGRRKQDPAGRESVNARLRRPCRSIRS